MVSGYQKTHNKAFYYSFYYKAAENRGKQRITEDNGTFTEYKEKAQKRYVSGLLKWLYYIVHEFIIYSGKIFVTSHLFFLDFFSYRFRHIVSSVFNDRIFNVLSESFRQPQKQVQERLRAYILTY